MYLTAYIKKKELIIVLLNFKMFCNVQYWEVCLAFVSLFFCLDKYLYDISI